MGPDWGRGLRGLSRTLGEKATVRYGPIGIPRGPPGALRGALGAISNFSQFSGFGPGPFSWKVSVVALGEQAVP